MKIELIIDENCISNKTYVKLRNKLAQELAIEEIAITSYSANQHRLRNLGINLLPAWLVDDKVLRIDPGDYDVLKKKIKERY